jgi:hypothetical protein
MHLDICQQHLDHYGSEHVGFLGGIITNDKTWMHYHKPMSKQQSME